MIYKVLRKQHSSSDCIGCGLNNPFSMKARFYELEGDLCCALVTGGFNHQSYPGRMHGGMVSTLLDEVIGRAIYISEPGCFGVTSELNVRFKKPVPLEEEIRVVGRVTRNTRLLFVAEGFIEDRDGNILATGSGTYIKMGINRIAGRPLTQAEWFIEEDDVKEIEIRNADFFEKK